MPVVWVRTHHDHWTDSPAWLSRDVALELAERVTVLHYGRVVADGPTEAVRQDPRVTEIYLGASDA